ncbi:hypothetical protein K2X85_13765 [bacterium]|nr:hypothetical protein [bacterium]
MSNFNRWWWLGLVVLVVVAASTPLVVRLVSHAAAEWAHQAERRRLEEQGWTVYSIEGDASQLHALSVCYGTLKEIEEHHTSGMFDLHPEGLRLFAVKIESDKIVFKPMMNPEKIQIGQPDFFRDLVRWLSGSPVVSGFTLTITIESNSISLREGDIATLLPVTSISVGKNTRLVKVVEKDGTERYLFTTMQSD